MHPKPYDTIAEWYHRTIQSSSTNNDVVLASLLHLLGDVQGKRICDVACGQGRVSRILAQQGASVTGFDISHKLIAIAQELEQTQPLGIIYQIEDATTGSRIESNSFDIAVCNLALMDMIHLEAAFSTIHRILKYEGIFICSMTHPCFEAPHAQWETGTDGMHRRSISRYFEEGYWYSTNLNGVRGKVGAFHRTLSTYINTIIRSGFMIMQIIEPQPTEEAQLVTPGHKNIPAFFLIEAKSIA
jgi:2-polyprenyl-3-methyl-5-hydroxy-6-metoxy-1,4-benzoquinol methylase